MSYIKLSNIVGLKLASSNPKILGLFGPVVHYLSKPIEYIEIGLTYWTLLELKL